jgi:sigma-B regulation protein RsbU (phosphoserine phosphatase)
MDRQPSYGHGRLWLGVLAILTLAGQILEAERAPRIPDLGMTLRESRVISVVDHGPAAAAGIRPGDTIRGMAGHALPPGSDTFARLKSQVPGVPLEIDLSREGEPLVLTLTPAVPSHSEVLWRLALAAVSVITVLVGLVVYIRKPSDLSLIFGAICLGLGFLVHPPFVPPVGAFLAARELVLEAMALLIPPLFVHLFLLFPVRHPVLQRRPRLPAWLYLPGLSLLVASLVARWRLDPGRHPEHWLPTATAVGATLLWAIGILAAVGLFLQAYRRARSETARRKLRVVLWGTLLGTLPLAAVLLLHLAWPRSHPPGEKLAAAAMVLIPLSFGYAIVRHGAFDATGLVRRSLATSVLGATLVLAYFGLQVLLRALLPRLLTSLWIPFVSLLAVALLVRPARRAVDRLLGPVIGAPQREEGNLLHEFGRRLAAESQPDRLARLITDSLCEALGAQRAAYFEPAGPEVLEARYLHGLPPAALGRHRFTAALSRQLRQLTHPIDWADLETELPFGYLPAIDQAILESLDAELLVPLRAGEEVRGVVLLGDPVLGEPFGAEEHRLAETIAAEGGLALENARLHARAREEETWQEEVDVARDLQERLRPKRLPQVESLEVSGVSIPCRGVGGDYYDCFRTPWGEIVLAIGDASGKGVPGALLMTHLHGLVHDFGARADPPSTIVARINRHLCEMQKPERYITFGLARIDPLTGKLAYCNAGHPSLVLMRGSGEIEELALGGLPLGIRPQAGFQGGETVMRTGDVLLLYTDGITERRRGQEEYGKERLHALMRERHRSSARALQNAILTEVRGFAETPLDDDTTLLLVRML